jgi:hypothetical protein
VDHPPGRARAEERLPGGGLIAEVRTERNLLRKVPALRFGEGEDITLGGALASALQASREDRVRLYDDALAGSGIAFELRVDESWDPEMVSPHDPDAVARAAAAVGLRADVVEPPFDEDLRELVWDRIRESVDAGLPPLARRLLQLPEFGVVTGYDAKERVLFARTYADHGDDPARTLFADAFGGDRPATIAFLDRAGRVDEPRLARDALRRAAEVGGYEAPYRVWITGLQQEAPAREIAQRAFVDHARRVFLHDARRSAARFLRRVRRHFPDRVGADLIRAAESYSYVADETEKSGVKPFDASVVARFVDPGQRRGWQHALERALERDREAAAALSAAAGAA